MGWCSCPAPRAPCLELFSAYACGSGSRGTLRCRLLPTGPVSVCQCPSRSASPGRIVSPATLSAMFAWHALQAGYGCTAGGAWWAFLSLGAWAMRVHFCLIRHGGCDAPSSFMRQAGEVGKFVALQLPPLRHVHSQVPSNTPCALLSCGRADARAPTRVRS